MSAETTITLLTLMLAVYPKVIPTSLRSTTRHRTMSRTSKDPITMACMTIVIPKGCDTDFTDDVPKDPLVMDLRANQLRWWKRWSELNELLNRATAHTTMVPPTGGPHGPTAHPTRSQTCCARGCCCWGNGIAACCGCCCCYCSAGAYAAAVAAASAPCFAVAAAAAGCSQPFRDNCCCLHCDGYCS